MKRNLFSRSRVIEALRDARFSVYPGESFELVGEGGSGTNTTAAMIVRLRKDVRIVFQYGTRSSTG